CKRGLVWGELEFVLPEDKVVRLHGTEWSETQQFHRYLDAHWRHTSQVLCHSLTEVQSVKKISSAFTPVRGACFRQTRSHRLYLRL
ncbi:DNA helicase IV, partial [Salmonella enterica subsp. enterica serovar Muenster]|nr:DNA helicase IV [Salmonella enterica subsp. enterica serovar Muenster]